MYALFKANADKPPIFKNQPPVAGAISWERSLFLRIKHTILRFQEMEDMLNSEQGKLVRLSDEIVSKGFSQNCLKVSVPLHCGGLLDGLIGALVPGWKGQGLCPVLIIVLCSWAKCLTLLLP